MLGDGFVPKTRSIHFIRKRNGWEQDKYSVIVNSSSSVAASPSPDGLRQSHFAVSRQTHTHLYIIQEEERRECVEWRERGKKRAHRYFIFLPRLIQGISNLK